MGTTTGTVEGISTKFDKFSVLLDDGKWYGTKQEWAPTPAPVRGDVVTFDSGPTGKYFSKVKIMGGGTGGGAPTPASGSPSAAPVRASTGRSFPVAALAPERTINRQSGLRDAIEYAKNNSEGMSPDEVIAIARVFEAYTTGDLDQEEAKAAMKAMTEG